MIEIYLLEHLLAFNEYGTLSAAAEHLNIAQPSLSRSMQKLEGTLNVTLFERQKNRIILNETGNLLPKAAGSFSDMTVSSAIDTEDNLIKGLRNSEYNIIILSKPLEHEDMYCKKYCTEQLYLSVTPFHPAASYQKVSFADMDGQNFIMYAHVGFWEDIVREKMPHAKFFKQEDMEAVGELARFSDLPSFASDITLKTMESRHNNRIHIPFSDSESLAAYYLVCDLRSKTKFNSLFQT